jgi:cobalt-zinc-cadmium efflux system membrane fusion protein
MNNKVAVFSTYLIALSSCCLLTFCKGKKTGSQKNEYKYEVTSAMLDQLLLDTVKLHGAVIQTHLNGKVQPAEDKLIRVFPLVSGIAEAVNIQQGDQVVKGQLLASLQSPEIAGFAKDATVSRTNLSNAQRAMDLGEDLYRSGLSSLKELEQLRGEYQKALAEDQKNQAVLQMNRSGKKQAYELRTPLAGFVVEKNITAGTHVRSDYNQSLFTIADLSTVYVILNIYESDIASIRQGDKVRITTLSYPDRVFEGKIEKIYDQLEPESRVMKARVSIPNPDFILKPGMFANVEVSSHQSNDLPYINANDLVFDKNRSHVLVMETRGKIRIQPVELGKRMEDKVFVLAGLKAGDRVVASRQVYLFQALKN